MVYFKTPCQWLLCIIIFCGLALGTRLIIINLILMSSIHTIFELLIFIKNKKVFSNIIKNNSQRDSTDGKDPFDPSSSTFYFFSYVGMSLH